MSETTPDAQRIDDLEASLKAIRINLSETQPPDWTWWRNRVMEHIDAALHVDSDGGHGVAEGK